jgi:hypothetical protein
VISGKNGLGAEYKIFDGRNSASSSVSETIDRMSINKHLISEILRVVFNDFHADTVCTSGHIASNDNMINEQ